MEILDRREVVFETTEVVDVDAIFEERICELLLPCMHAIQPQLQVQDGHSPRPTRQSALTILEQQADAGWTDHATRNPHADHSMEPVMLESASCSSPRVDHARKDPMSCERSVLNEPVVPASGDCIAAAESYHLTVDQMLEATYSGSQSMNESDGSGRRDNVEKCHSETALHTGAADPDDDQHEPSSAIMEHFTTGPSPNVLASASQVHASEEASPRNSSGGDQCITSTVDIGQSMMDQSTIDQPTNRSIVDLSTKDLSEREQSMRDDTMRDQAALTDQSVTEHPAREHSEVGEVEDLSIMEDQSHMRQPIVSLCSHNAPLEIEGRLVEEEGIMMDQLSNMMDEFFTEEQSDRSSIDDRFIVVQPRMEQPAVDEPIMKHGSSADHHECELLAPDQSSMEHPATEHAEVSEVEDLSMMEDQSHIRQPTLSQCSHDASLAIEGQIVESEGALPDQLSNMTDEFFTEAQSDRSRMDDRFIVGQHRMEQPAVDEPMRENGSSVDHQECDLLAPDQSSMEKPSVIGLSTMGEQTIDRLPQIIMPAGPDDGERSCTSAEDARASRDHSSPTPSSAIESTMGSGCDGGFLIELTATVDRLAVDIHEDVTSGPGPDQASDNDVPFAQPSTSQLPLSTDAAASTIPCNEQVTPESGPDQDSENKAALAQPMTSPLPWVADAAESTSPRNAHQHHNHGDTASMGLLPQLAEADEQTISGSNQSVKHASVGPDSTSAVADQLPLLAPLDGQLAHSAANVQRQAGSRRSQIDQTRRREWGTSWSPGFPTDRQLAREVDNLFRAHERARAGASTGAAMLHRPAAGGGAAAVRGAREHRATASVGRRGGEAESAGARAAGVATTAPLAPSRLPQVAGSSTRRAPGGLAFSASSPGPVPPRPEARPRRRHEPAKVLRGDGRMVLRGVNSTSDLDRYARGVDLHSRKGFEVRRAFKMMRSSQHAAVAQETWNALYSLQASERPFEEWYASAKEGTRYHFK